MIEKMEKHRVFVEVFVKGKTCPWNSYQEIMEEYKDLIELRKSKPIK